MRKYVRTPTDQQQSKAIIDPRLGDIEADALSTKKRTILALAGNLLAEISLPKLLTVWLLLIAIPAVVLGLTPLVTTAWLAKFFDSLTRSYAGVGPFVIFLAVVGVGWYLSRPLRRVVEEGFWTLNSIVVLPAYTLFREGTRHALESIFAKRLDDDRRARLRSASAAAAGLLLCILSLVILLVVWPWSRWSGNLIDLITPHLLIVPALANAVVIVCGYCAGAALVWGLADATMDQPRTYVCADRPVGRKWRIAHLSDIHVVGERFGFRIESGRAGPRGNDRVEQVMATLSTLHAERALDYILITGDITDAGRSAEWAEFQTILSRYPDLAALVLLVPGNHDINVADRTNPARLDMPTSPGRLLREMRTLSALAMLQANEVETVDPANLRLGESLATTLSPHIGAIARFANTGKFRGSGSLKDLWASVFPMIVPPQEEDGLGIVLLNSTAQTHFSFTNALGLVSSEQSEALCSIIRQFPKAHWIVALHHHLVEYPSLTHAFSERIGTALINGSWFVRQLQQFGDRIVVMHGHRHIDWIGCCGPLRIVSAPSPVMESTGEDATFFYIHTLGADATGTLQLLPPERVEIPGSALL